MLEVGEDEFLDAKQEERHEELIKSLGSILTALSNKTDINKEIISKFSEIIKSLPVPNITVEPNVNLNQEQVILNQEALLKELVIISEQLKKKKEWIHTVNENKFGDIVSITSKQIN